MNCLTLVDHCTPAYRKVVAHSILVEWMNEHIYSMPSVLIVFHPFIYLQFNIFILHVSWLLPWLIIQSQWSTPRDYWIKWNSLNPPYMLIPLSSYCLFCLKEPWGHFCLFGCFPSSKLSLRLDVIWSLPWPLPLG